MDDDSRPAAFIERLDEVEEELARGRGARSKAWRYLTLRVPVIAALLYLVAQLDELYWGVGLIFVAAAVDLLLARRKERALEAERDALLAHLEKHGRIPDGEATTSGAGARPD